MLNSIGLYKGIFLHVIPVGIIVPWLYENKYIPGSCGFLLQTYKYALVVKYT